MAALTIFSQSMLPLAEYIRLLLKLVKKPLGSLATFSPSMILSRLSRKIQRDDIYSF